MVERYGISRDEQDTFAKSSYTKSKAAWEVGKFDLLIFLFINVSVFPQSPGAI